MQKAIPSEITLVKPGFLKRELHLLHNTTVIGKIQFPSRFKMNADVILFDEKWTITQSGFWKPFLEFKGHERPFTKVKVRQKIGGKVEWTASDNHPYFFRKTKWWTNTWAWYDENKKPVLEIRPDHSFSNKQAQISIMNPNHPDIRLMLLMGVFVYLIQKRHAAAAAST